MGLSLAKTAARVELSGAGAIPRRSLADRINSMNPEERDDFQKEMQQAFIAKAARTEDSDHLPCKAFNKLNGGRCTDSDGCFYSGCTNPIVTREVIQDLKMKLSPVNKPVTIIQADGSALNYWFSIHLFGSQKH